MDEGIPTAIEFSLPLWYLHTLLAQKRRYRMFAFRE